MDAGALDGLAGFAPGAGRLLFPFGAAAGAGAEPVCLRPFVAGFTALIGVMARGIIFISCGWPEFAVMRELVMRFRGMLRSKNTAKLPAWLKDAQQSGLYAMKRFSRTLRRDIDAVKNAITEQWSNGQTEGQISRLKTLKRAMYGRAGSELLRARILPP